MSSEIYNRIYSLFSTLGFNMAENSTNCGEAAAYSAALDLITENFDNLFSELFVQTAKGKGLEKYLSLAGLKKDKDVGELRKNVISRFSKTGSLLSLKEFEGKMAECFGDEFYGVSGFSVYFLFGFNSNYASFKNTNDFVKKYVPGCCFVSFGGNGMNFDDLDSLNFSWYETDGFDFSFSALETIDLNKN